VAIVFLDHSGIGVAELRCHYRQRRAPHNEPAGVRVPEGVERDRERSSLRHRPRSTAAAGATCPTLSRPAGETWAVT
jgi:hypothetical protein